MSVLKTNESSGNFALLERVERTVSNNQDHDDSQTNRTAQVALRVCKVIAWASGVVAFGAGCVVLYMIQTQTDSDQDLFKDMGAFNATVINLDPGVLRDGILLERDSYLSRQHSESIINNIHNLFKGFQNITSNPLLCYLGDTGDVRDTEMPKNQMEHYNQLYTQHFDSLVSRINKSMDMLGILEGKKLVYQSAENNVTQFKDMVSKIAETMIRKTAATRTTLVFGVIGGGFAMISGIAIFVLQCSSIIRGKKHNTNIEKGGLGFNK